MATGGSYKSGNGAGVWNMEAVPCTDVFGTVTIQDITIVSNTLDELDISIQYVEGSGAVTNVGLVGDVLTVDLVDLDGLGSRNAAFVVAAVNSFYGSNEIEAFVSGNPNSLQAAFSTPVEFDDHTETGLARRTDVGFRCVIDVEEGDYD